MKNLVAALIKAQAEFKPIKKDCENPFFHSKYADLEACIEGTKDALIANGLAVIQTFGFVEGKSILMTNLCHVSGEMINGSQVLEVKDCTNPQSVASASTYARRYGYMAILGLAAEDDDANVASKPESKPTQIPKPEEKEVTTHDNMEGELVDYKVRDIISKKTGKPYKVADYTISADKGDTFDAVSSFDVIPCTIGDNIRLIGIKESEFKGKKQLTAMKVEKIEKEKIEIPF